MKKLLTLILGIALSTIAFSQDCNIGNQSTTGFGSTGDFTENFLLGSSFVFVGIYIIFCERSQS